MCTSDQEAIQTWIDKLVDLDEIRREGFDKNIIKKESIESTFDQSTRNTNFKVGEVVCNGVKNEKTLEITES